MIEAVLPFFKKGAVEDLEKYWLIKLISVSKTIMDHVLHTWSPSAAHKGQGDEEQSPESHEGKSCLTEVVVFYEEMSG